MTLVKVVCYTIFMYFYLIFIIRIMGKREVGSLSVFDLAVYFTISDLITISIVDNKTPLYITIISVAVLCILQILLAKITLKSKKARDIIDGKKSIIIKDGIIDFDEMKKQRYSIDDLYNQMREKGIDSITLVKWAILENNGKLSIITKKDSISNFPDPLISDGTILHDNLKLLSIDEKALVKKIKDIGILNIKDIRLCIYENNNLIFVLNDKSS